MNLPKFVLANLIISITFLSACKAFAPEPTPAPTETATMTLIPATSTFTPIPPTATYTQIPYTATNTTVPATNTPAIPPGPDVLLGEWYGRDVTDAFRLEFEVRKEGDAIVFDIITGIWEGRCTYAAVELRFVPLPEPLPIDQNGVFGNGFFDGEVVAPDRIVGTFRYPRCPNNIVSWTGVFRGN